MQKRVVDSAEMLTPQQIEIETLYGRDLRPPESYFYPTPENYLEIVTRISDLQANSSAIALVDGSFDVPHPAHEWYLRDCKLSAVRANLTQYGVNWAALSREEKLDAVASTDVALIVTVDSDDKLDRLKSRPEKGGVRRPIYPWHTRAERILGYAAPDSNGSLVSVVDLATVEGDETLADTPFASHTDLGIWLDERGLLDYWLFYEESQGAINVASQAGTLAQQLVMGQHRYANHPITGQPWSSSDIIRRAQGE